MNGVADKFADRLLEMGQKVHRAGDGKFEAQCPAHEDRAASLSIGTGDDGRLLVHCQAGCPFESVIEAAEWPISDCFPPKAPTIAPRARHAVKPAKAWPAIDGATEAARWGVSRQAGIQLDDVVHSQNWIYTDAGGGEVAAVVRFDLPTPAGEKQRKTFRPLHRVAAGWALGDPPGKWPLYRLPELVAALQSGERRVFVVEGERACDAAAACGLVVTASAHGSQSPGKTDWKPLAGAPEIVILPDADLPNPKTGRVAGELYAQQVAAQILAVRK